MEKILMTPGPTNIPDEVFKAMSVNMHHRTEEFAAVMENVQSKLRKLFNTKNDVLILLCSGTGGLEASIVNLFSPGDKLLCINCGVFGKRFADIARMYGVEVHEKAIQWGYGVNPEDIEEELKINDYKAVYATYSETSTGIKNDIKAIGKVVKKHGPLFIVDIVSALGGLEFDAENFNVDVAVAGSQKGLMCPPGLALVSMSDRAWNAVEKSTLPKFYFDFKKYRESKMSPYTPGVSVILGLNRALDMLFEEGIDNVLARHRRYSSIVKKSCNYLGLTEFPSKEFASEVLTALYVPDGIDGIGLIDNMQRNGVVIAGGQGKLKGRIIRIGHIGYVNDAFIIKTMDALSLSLNATGIKNDNRELIEYTKSLLGVKA